MRPSKGNRRGSSYNLSFVNRAAVEFDRVGTAVAAHDVACLGLGKSVS